MVPVFLQILIPWMVVFFIGLFIASLIWRDDKRSDA